MICMVSVFLMNVLYFSQTNIRTALDQLCNHLSTKLKTQCVDFVDQYTDQLVNMLISDMDAQQICVYLKLCTDNVADPLKLKGDTKPEVKLSAIDKFFERPEMQKDLNHFNKRKQVKEAEAKNVGGDIGKLLFLLGKAIFAIYFCFMRLYPFLYIFVSKI